jgi:hypothetical protein
MVPLGTVTVARKAPPWPPVTGCSTWDGVPRTTLTSWQGPVKPPTSTDPPAAVRPGVTVSIPGGGSRSTTKGQVLVIGSQWRRQSDTRWPPGAAPSGTAKLTRNPRGAGSPGQEAGPACTW